MSKEEEEQAREMIINRLFNMLKGQGEYVQSETISSPESKLVQADVLINTMKFLEQYTENVQVLNQYWLGKRRAEKFEQPTER